LISLCVCFFFFISFWPWHSRKTDRKMVFQTFYAQIKIHNRQSKHYALTFTLYVSGGLAWH
jgi:hypothetical protein